MHKLPCSRCSGNSTSGSGQMLVAATLIFFFPQEFQVLCVINILLIALKLVKRWGDCKE